MNPPKAHRARWLASPPTRGAGMNSCVSCACAIIKNRKPIQKKQKILRTVSTVLSISILVLAMGPTFARCLPLAEGAVLSGHRCVTVVED